MSPALGKWLCSAQGVYYAVTGLWPLVSMRTFLEISGPKTDLWLVNTVALLILVIGVTLLIAATEQKVPRSVILLGAGSAASLGWVDLYYSLTGVIWAVYMLDALAEVLIILGWGIVVWSRWFRKGDSVPRGGSPPRPLRRGEDLRA